MGYRKQLSCRSTIYLTKYIISFLFITVICKRLTWCCSFTLQHPSLTDMSMKKRKRSRWSSETPDQKTIIPGMPTVIPPGLTREQERAYIGNYEIWFFFSLRLICPVGGHPAKFIHLCSSLQLPFSVHFFSVQNVMCPLLHNNLHIIQRTWLLNWLATCCSDINEHACQNTASVVRCSAGLQICSDAL